MLFSTVIFASRSLHWLRIPRILVRYRKPWTSREKHLLPTFHAHQNAGQWASKLCFTYSVKVQAGAFIIFRTFGNLVSQFCCGNGCGASSMLSVLLDLSRFRRLREGGVMLSRPAVEMCGTHGSLCRFGRQLCLLCTRVIVYRVHRWYFHKTGPLMSKTASSLERLICRPLLLLLRYHAFNHLRSVFHQLISGH